MARAASSLPIAHSSFPAERFLPVDFHLPYAPKSFGHSRWHYGRSQRHNPGWTAAHTHRHNAIRCRPLAVLPTESRFSAACLPRTQSPTLPTTPCKRPSTSVLSTACSLPSRTRSASRSTKRQVSKVFSIPSIPAAAARFSNFDARHRIVFSYYWEMPKSHYNGVAGKVLNGWALSGITTFQTGFPIRIISSADNELMYSFDFELPGEPDQLKPFKTTRPQSTCFSGVCNYYFDPTTFTEDTSIDPSLFGRIGNAPRTICCGPHISNTRFCPVEDLWDIGDQARRFPCGNLQHL